MEESMAEAHRIRRIPPYLFADLDRGRRRSGGGVWTW